MFRPFRQVVELIRDLVWRCLRDLGLDVRKDNIKVEETKSRAYGDFFTTVAFSIAKRIYGKNFRKHAFELAEKLAHRINNIKPEIIDRVEATNGYVNFFLNRGEFAKFVLEGIMRERETFGVFESGEKSVIIEHTSANPIHPLHIGHARNAFIGDCLARIHKFIGNKTSRRFYVNDCGKQVAILAYGLGKTKHIQLHNVKIDHFYGAVYSCTASLLELNRELRKLIRSIRKLRAALKSLTYGDDIHRFFVRSFIQNIALGQDGIIEKIRDFAESNNISKLKAHLQVMDTLFRASRHSLDILSNIALKWPRIYYTLSFRIDPDAEKRIKQIIKKYESGSDEKLVKDIKHMVDRVLGAFKGTLGTLGIEFDAFDWESDLIRGGLVEKIINKLMEKGYAYKDSNTRAVFLDVRKILEIFPEMQEFYFDGKKHADISNVKNPVLVRKDGTTLYLARDIAYAYYKLQTLEANLSISVIGVDQKLEQKHVVLALRALGITDVLSRYKHLAYELIRLPGRKMSSRRGQYISLDEILVEAIRRAFNEVDKRYPQLNANQKFALAKEIAIGAIKYALLGQAPGKVIVFDWSRVLDFEQNSGPFIQYAHARAASILRKASWRIPRKCDLTLLKTSEEFEVIYKLSKFPEVLEEVTRTCRPDILVGYVNELAMLFNKFYQKHPVLKAENEELKKARLVLVAAFRRVIANAMKLLGIAPLYRM